MEGGVLGDGGKKLRKKGKKDGEAVRISLEQKRTAQLRFLRGE